MIKRNYSGNQRQACNVIWNAAGRYDYDPPFMAFRTNGTPDFYFNMIIGRSAVHGVQDERNTGFLF